MSRVLSHLNLWPETAKGFFFLDALVYLGAIILFLLTDNIDFVMAGLMFLVIDRGMSRYRTGSWLGQPTDAGEDNQ